MATIKWKRANKTSRANNYLGANGEVVIDMEQNRIFLYDGSNAYVSNTFVSAPGTTFTPPAAVEEEGTVSFSLQNLTTTEKVVEWNLFIDPSTYGGVAMSPDGCNVYVGSRTYETIWQWRMDEPWDWANVYYHGQMLITTGRPSITTYNFDFNSDGTAIYQNLYFSSTEKRIWKRELSVPWDLTSATWNYFGEASTLSPNFNRGYIGIHVRSDNVVYGMDTGNDTVFEFSGTDSNIETFTETANVYIGGEESAPTDLSFSPSGNAFYTIGTSGDVLEEWVMSTPWDIANATISANSTSLGGLNAYSIKISPDGQHILWVDNNTRMQVNHASFSTPWDLSTISIDEPIRLGHDTAYRDIESFSWDINGSNAYVSSNDWLFQFKTKQPWDLERLPLRPENFINPGDLATGIANGLIKGHDWKTDGTKLYVHFDVDDTIHSFTLSTAWDLSTASWDNSISPSISGSGGNLESLAISDDGTKVYVCRSVGLYQGTMSTAWDISTTTLDSTTPVTFDSFSGGNAERGMDIAPGGEYMYLTMTTPHEIYRIHLSTPYDIYSTLTLTHKFPGAVGIGGNGGLRGNPYGNNFVTIDTTSPTKLYQYHLSTPNTHIKTSVVNTAFDHSSVELVPRDIWFNPTGNTMLILGQQGDAIDQWRLSDSWNVETAISNGTFSVGSQEPSPEGMTWSSNGQIFYVVGRTADTIFKYETTVPWDINFASYNSESKQADRAADIYGVVIHPSNNIIYIMQTNKYMEKWDMENEHDLLNAVLKWTDAALDNYLVDDESASMKFNSDGTKLWLVSFTSREIVELDVLRPYDLNFLRRNPAGTFIEPTRDGRVRGVYVSETANAIFTTDDLTDQVNSFRGVS